MRLCKLTEVYLNNIRKEYNLEYACPEKESCYDFNEFILLHNND